MNRYAQLLKPAVDAESTRRHHGVMTDSKKRQIVGISLSPDTARAFKAEAAARGVTVKTLFEEMWAMYQKSPRKART